MFDLYDNDFERAFDEAVDAIEKKEHRLIWADALKRHYSWWKGGTREMTMDEAKNDFDTIIDLQPTVEPKHGYDKGYEDGIKFADERFKEDCETCHYRAAVKHGRWNAEHLCSTGGGTYPIDRCSNCGYASVVGKTKYCPNCGAKMDEARK